MPEETNSNVMEFNGWTLRVRPAVLETARFMLLLHGWTGDENSMWVFTRNFSEDMWISAPRAPHTADQGGFSWRTLHPGTWGLPTLSDLKPAAESLIRLVDDLSASMGVDASQFDVAGFSQGGALTNILALTYPNRVRKAAVLAGFMPEGVDDLIAQRVLKDKLFYVAHGSQDDLVPIARARESVDLLEAAGAKVHFCQAEVGHKLSLDCLRGFESFLGIA